MYHQLMSVKWDTVAARLSTQGSDGKFHSAITGNESEKELRELVEAFIEKCPCSREHIHCPFYILRGLYHASLKTLLDGLTRQGLVGLFEIECELRNAKTHPCVQSDAQTAVDPEPTT